MNLQQIIAYQKSQLKTTSIIHKLWAKLKGKAAESIADLEEEEFQRHLPLQLEEFFGECVLKAKSCLQENSNLFDELDYKYLCSLIYFMLTRTDAEGQADNITLLINVGSLYLTLNYLQNSENTIFFNDIYIETVKILDYIRAANYKQSPLLMFLDDFRMFLSQSKTILNQNSLLHTISSLSEFVFLDNTTLFENFSEEGMNFHGGKTAYLAFCCYQAIISKNYSKKLDMSNARLAVVLSLMSCFKSNTAPIRMLSVFQRNVQNFIQDTSPYLLIEDDHLLVKAVQVIIPKPEYDCYEEIAALLRNLPLEQFQAFVQWTAYAMVSDNKSYKRYFPNIAVFIVKNPPDSGRFSKCEVVVEMLTQNIIKLTADSCNDIRENAIKNLDELLKINDASVKIALRRILSREEELHSMNAKSILIILKKNVDLKWTKVATNQRIINILCQFIILRDDYFLTQQTIDILLKICLTAKPFHLKPCISSLHILIQACLGFADNVVKVIISIFIHQMFKENSSLFIRELWKMIFGEPNTKKNKMDTWSIANLILSHNFDWDKIFKKFADEKLLDNELVQNVINNVQEQPTAWKLLNVLCKYVKFNDWFKIERYILQSVTTKTFSDTSVYMFSSFNGMLKNRSVNSEQEMCSLRMILSLLCNNFISLVLPLNSLPAIVELISTISNLTATFPIWAKDALTILNGRLQRSLTCIITKNLDCIVEVERDIVYTAELITISKDCVDSVSTDNLDLLKRIMNTDLQSETLREFLSRHSSVWTQCLILYSKIMIQKGGDDSLELSQVLQKTLEYSDPNVQLPALYALYDLCRIYFEYFDPIIPYLFTMIDQNNGSVRLASAKIIMECIDNDVIKLKDTYFLLFISLIIDHNEDVRKTVIKYMKESFFLRNERSIAQNFVFSVFHLNQYHDHPMLQLSPSDVRILQRRRYLHPDLSQMFYFLFRNVSKKTQFNVVETLTKQVLVPALSNTLDYCTKAEKIRVFEDSLLLIMKFALLNETLDITDTKEFYEDQIKTTFKKLLISKGSSHTPKSNVKNHYGVLKVVLKTLLELTEKIGPNYCNTLELICRTTVIFVKGFFDNLNNLVCDDNTLKYAVENFLEIYKKHSSRFMYEKTYVPEQLDYIYSIDL